MRISIWNQYTKYNVHFAYSAVVKGILIIQSVQRDATTQTPIFQVVFSDCRIQQRGVGSRDENTLQNYIRRQDISGQLPLAV